MKCEKCGGELIEGMVTSMQTTYFYPTGEEKKLKPKRSMIGCGCCSECGHLQDFKALEPEKLK